jgi:hypothetical protein
MTDDTCTFSYISKKDFAPKTATGVERSWFDLKIEFGRQGDGLSGAKYYKTVSKEGPQLFAVKLDQSVWYHDEGKWHKYQTATDVKYEEKKSNDDDDDVNDPCFGMQVEEET